MIQKVTVLIIEDERSICDFMAKTLNAHDYRTITAQTGRDGLAFLTSALPDLVLLDLGLPDMDGIDIIKETRQWSSVPIIAVSSTHLSHGAGAVYNHDNHIHCICQLYRRIYTGLFRTFRAFINRFRNNRRRNYDFNYIYRKNREKKEIIL